MKQPMATFECLACYAKRPYGTNEPRNSEMPWLNCGDCQRTGPHSFVGMRYWAYDTHPVADHEGSLNRVNVEWLGMAEA